MSNRLDLGGAWHITRLDITIYPLVRKSFMDYPIKDSDNR